MTTALAVRQLNQDGLNMIMQVAPMMHEARLFGTKSQQQAAAIMIKGYELGFSITASFENIHVIEDKPSLSPKGCLALIYGSPECAGVKITDEVDGNNVPVACTVWMKRRNGLEYTVRFSMDDAKRADVVKDKSGWTKYPANMLRWRAVGYCADIVFPDVIGGTKRADEFGADLTPDGDVIDGSWTNVGSQQVTVAQPQAAPAVTVSQSQPVTQPVADPDRLQRLLNNYGAGAIMAANDNKIPATDDELATVELVLGVAK